jgi:hypothetical protein
MLARTRAVGLDGLDLNFSTAPPLSPLFFAAASFSRATLKTNQKKLSLQGRKLWPVDFKTNKFSCECSILLEVIKWKQAVHKLKFL